MATTAAPVGNPTFTVSFTEQKPFFWSKINSQNSVSYHGFLKDLLDEVASRLEWNLNYEPVSDGKGIGTLAGGPGQYNGVLGDVQNDRAHIGAGAITVTPERERAVDFTKPFLKDTVNMLVHKPQWDFMGLGYLVRPISSDFWIMLMVSFLLVGLVFFIIGKFSPYEWGNVAADRDPRGARNAFSLRNSYLFAITTFTWQGFREAPRSLSGRLMAACWWLFVMFSMVAYTANLTAYFLARPEVLPNMPFTTYEDLASTDITVLAKRFGSTDRSMAKSRDSTITSLHNKMQGQNSFVDSYIEGVKRVVSGKGNAVMLMEASSAEYHARQNCDLMIYGEDLFPTNLAFVVKKPKRGEVNLNLASKINDEITKLKGEGWIDSKKEMFWKYGGQGCQQIDGREYLKNAYAHGIPAAGYMSKMPVYPITLKDMAVAIFFLFIGLLLSMILMIVEIVHYNVTKKGKKLHRPAVVKTAQARGRAIYDQRLRKRGDRSRPPADVEAPAAAPMSDDENMESVPLDYNSEDPDQVLSDDAAAAPKPAAEEKVTA